MTLRLSGCPRCGGALHDTEDAGDRACLQCGHVQYELPPLRIQAIGMSASTSRLPGVRGKGRAGSHRTDTQREAG